MIDQRERFERAFELFEMPDPAFERLVRRRDRKRRNQRVAAAILALGLVFVSAVWFRSLVTRPVRVPADHPVTPIPTATPTPPPSSSTGSHLGLTYAVPDRTDWSIDDEYPRELWFTQPDTSSRILVGSRARAATRDCAGEQATPGDQGFVASRDGIAAWMVNSPDLEATAPQHVTLGGLDALQLDVVTSPGAATAACGGIDGVPLIVVDDWGEFRDSFDDHVWPLPTDERFRVYLLEDPSGGDNGVLVIIIGAPRDEFGSFVVEAVPILDSFVFEG